MMLILCTRWQQNLNSIYIIVIYRQHHHYHHKAIMAQLDKMCMVCGDKALGYNFNAVTCESCKAFFRRNALSSKDFSCPFSGTCEISVITRRFCQRCRLQKCFKIGMRKEYIMTEEDKLIKVILIMPNVVHVNQFESIRIHSICISFIIIVIDSEKRWK